MSNSIKENINTDIFPYDFVKENEVIAFQNGEGIVVSSPKPISLNLYQEIQRFLNSDFRFELCDSNKFNEILTNSFTSSDHQKNISEELTDEFNLQDFAGSINATEDLLSGNNDAPIIKLINGVISQAIKVIDKAYKNRKIILIGHESITITELMNEIISLLNLSIKKTYELNDYKIHYRSSPFDTSTENAIRLDLNNLTKLKLGLSDTIKSIKDNLI